MAKFYRNLTIIVFSYLLASSSVNGLGIPLPGIFKENLVLPSPTTFLSNLFNITADKVSGIANSFIFAQSEVSPNDIRILYYKSDGFFSLYRLNGTRIPLKPNQDIKILIHGYKSFGTANWAEEISRTYHRIGVTNTLAIDWNGVANQGYLKSASSTRRLGNLIANWIFYKLLQGNPKRLQNIHLIGHSLGAHISGFVGKRVSQITGGKYLIRKISGLDAAAPIFEFPVKLPPQFRINRQDAQIVEGYHTNTGFYGFLSEFGHQDFYISYGGPIQPGCYKINILKALQCSHSLAQEIFRKTIESRDYLATRCPNRFLKFAHACAHNEKIIMGEHSNATKPYGSYFINIDKNVNPT